VNGPGARLVTPRIAMHVAMLQNDIRAPYPRQDSQSVALTRYFKQLIIAVEARCVNDRLFRALRPF